MVVNKEQTKTCKLRSLSNGVRKGGWGSPQKRSRPQIRMKFIKNYKETTGNSLKILQKIIGVSLKDAFLKYNLWIL